MIALIRALPLLWQIGIAAALVGGTAVTYGVWHHKVYQSGWDAAMAHVAAANKEASDAAKKLKSKADECVDAGRAWSESRGVCD